MPDISLLENLPKNPRKKSENTPKICPNLRATFMSRLRNAIAITQSRTYVRKSMARSVSATIVKKISLQA